MRAIDRIRDTGGVVWDNHLCMPFRSDDTFLPELERCRASGLDVVSLNVGCGDMSIEKHVRTLAYFRAWISKNSDSYVVPHTVQDIRDARAAGKLSVVFDIEGMLAVDDEPALVQMYYDLGVKWMLIAYNRNNKAGGGCQDDDTGLTDLGRRIIDEMERVGMVVCLSHTGYRTAREVLDYATNPVLFSHSNPRALVDHPRNIPDDLMERCAATGGVMGINGVGKFLGDADAGTDAIIAHLDYAVGRIGVDHVGLSLDYCFDEQELIDYVKAHPELFPPDQGYVGGFTIAEPEQYPGIADGLLARGYSDGDVAKVLGLNFLRVAEAVWR
ncbi:MAG: membrane dipeptidase [Sphingomonadales bacterium]